MTEIIPRIVLIGSQFLFLVKFHGLRERDHEIAGLNSFPRRLTAWEQGLIWIVGYELFSEDQLTKPLDPFICWRLEQPESSSCYPVSSFASLCFLDFYLPSFISSQSMNCQKNGIVTIA
jgi:hypothetical protein